MDVKRKGCRTIQRRLKTIKDETGQSQLFKTESAVAIEKVDKICLHFRSRSYSR